MQIVTSEPQVFFIVRNTFAMFAGSKLWDDHSQKATPRAVLADRSILQAIATLPSKQSTVI